MNSKAYPNVKILMQKMIVLT